MLDSIRGQAWKLVVVALLLLGLLALPGLFVGALRIFLNFWLALSLMVILVLLLFKLPGRDRIPETEAPPEPYGPTPLPKPSGGPEPIREHAPAKPFADQLYGAVREDLEPWIQRWQELVAERQEAGDAAPGAVQARTTAALFEDWIRLLRRLGEGDDDLERFQREVDRLRARAAAQGGAGFDPSLPELAEPDSQQRSGAGFLEYLEHVAEVCRSVRRSVRALEEQLSQGSRDRAPVEWQLAAENLLVQVADVHSHPETLEGRVGEDEVGQLYQRLLELLELAELKVEVGEPLDRRRHQIDSHVASRDLAPNRVAAVVLPGFKRRSDGEVHRKALVRMSEQSLT